MIDIVDRLIDYWKWKALCEKCDFDPELYEPITEEKRMDLVQERESWRKEMESGTFFVHHMYQSYKMNRNSPYWRSTKQLERLFEYIMYLEEQLKPKEEHAIL